MHKHYCFIIIGIFSVIAIVASATSLPISIALKSLVDPFLYSTSIVNVYLFFGFIFCQCLFSILIMKRNILRDSIHAHQFFVVLSSVCLLIVALIGFYFLVNYATRIHSELLLSHFHFSQSDVSYNYLLHSHMAKTALTDISQAMFGVSRQLDSGAVFS